MSLKRYFTGVALVVCGLSVTWLAAKQDQRSWRQPAAQSGLTDDQKEARREQKRIRNHNSGHTSTYPLYGSTELETAGTLQQTLMNDKPVPQYDIAKPLKAPENQTKPATNVPAAKAPSRSTAPSFAMDPTLILPDTPEQTDDTCAGLRDREGPALNGPLGKLTDRQSLTIHQMTGIFENATTIPQYDYIEDIDDGSGITAGTIGFTATAGDLLQVVTDYVNSTDPKVNKQLQQGLNQYLPCLQLIYKQSNAVSPATVDNIKPGPGNPAGSYGCLYPDLSDPTLSNNANTQSPLYWDNEQTFKHGTSDTAAPNISRNGFGAAWVAAADHDPVMQAVQDSFVEKTNFKPAMEWAYRLNLKTPFSKALMYDVQVQMGGPTAPSDQTNTKSTPMLALVRKAFIAKYPNSNGIPAANDPYFEQEFYWDQLFQQERYTALNSDPVGATTTSRVVALNIVGFQWSCGFLNLAIALPINFQYAGNPFSVTADDGKDGPIDPTASQTK